MLLITFTTLVFSSVQWISHTLRYQRYMNIINKVLQRASLVIQRPGLSSVCVNKAIRSTLLANTNDITEKTEFDDDSIHLSSVVPVQEVALGSWTSYLGCQSLSSLPDTKQVSVLMEVQQSGGSVNREMTETLAQRVHTLTGASPVLWKLGHPFSMILKCSREDLLSLTDNFSRGSIKLGTDLELIRLTTVNTVGMPQGHTPSNSGEGSSLLNEVKGHEVDLDSVDALVMTESLVSSKTISQSDEKPINKVVLEPNASQQDKRKYDDSIKTKYEITTTSENNILLRDENQKNSLSENSDSIPKSGINQNDNKSSKGAKPSPKPPNILIYCGVTHSTENTASTFMKVKDSVEACINTEAYTVYHLVHESLLSAPWGDNAALLIVSSCSQLHKDAEDAIVDLVMNKGGNLLSFNSSVDSKFVKTQAVEAMTTDGLVTLKLDGEQLVTAAMGRFFYSGFKEGSEVLVPYTDTHPISVSSDLQCVDAGVSSDTAMVVQVCSDTGGKAVLSQLLLERDPTDSATDADFFSTLKASNSDRLTLLSEMLSRLGIITGSDAAPILTSCYMLSHREGLRESFIKSVQSRLKDSILKSRLMSLKFVSRRDQSLASEDLLPVITDAHCTTDTAFFDLESYWQNLSSRSMGQVLFYTDVIPTTMTVFDGLLFSIPDGVGVVAVAGRQTSGKGRGGNKWLSPLGCAMFTLPVKLSQTSRLGQRVSYLQHMVAVAVVQAVKTLRGYENIDLKVKWPNDIYYSDKMKVGGVLVTSTMMDSSIYATIGCGFNVDNSNPTICINDIIRQHNRSHSNEADLDPLYPAQLIARTVSCLEELIDQFEIGGHEAFCEEYYTHWLHSGKRVKVTLDRESEGTIAGLDEYGFLSIQTDEGHVISVQPDGNSFDMMANLIHFKTR